MEIDFFNYSTRTHFLPFEWSASAVQRMCNSLEYHNIRMSSATEPPNSAWVVEQTEEFLDQTNGRALKPSIVMHDRDTKFTKKFTATLKAKGIRTNVLPIASLNLNGRVERFIQMIKYECLFKFILFGKQHLDHIVSEFTDYYSSRGRT